MRALLILLRWPFHRWLHRRCLRRIALLERELGIYPPYELEAMPRYDGITADYEFKPGAMWRVNDARKVQWLEDGSKLTTLMSYTQIQAASDVANAALKHKMAAMNLLYNGTSWCQTCGEHGPVHAHHLEAPQ